MTEPESHACECASRSVMGPDKSQNGDHALTCDTGASETGASGTGASDADGGPVVLAVADGVGSRPCDWRASEVACAAAVETNRGGHPGSHRPAR